MFIVGKTVISVINEADMGESFLVKWFEASKKERDSLVQIIFFVVLNVQRRYFCPDHRVRIRQK